MTKEYTKQDLIDSITELCPENYAAQSGHFRGILWSVLNYIESLDPELFKEIMEFEMRVSERLRVTERLLK